MKSIMFFSYEFNPACILLEKATLLLIQYEKLLGVYSHALRLLQILVINLFTLL